MRRHRGRRRRNGRLAQSSLLVAPRPFEFSPCAVGRQHHHHCDVRLGHCRLASREPQASRASTRRSAGFIGGHCDVAAAASQRVALCAFASSACIRASSTRTPIQRARYVTQRKPIERSHCTCCASCRRALVARTAGLQGLSTFAGRNWTVRPPHRRNAPLALSRCANPCRSAGVTRLLPLGWQLRRATV